MFNEARGKIDELTGKAKVALGKATGSKRWQAEGRAEQAKGAARRVGERIRASVLRLVKR